jgi:hypothetical protein
MIICISLILVSSVVFATNINDRTHLANLHPILSEESPRSSDRIAVSRSSYQKKLRSPNKPRNLALSFTFPTLADFFNFTLAITPDQASNTSACNITDEVTLQSEVDLVLLNFGAGNLHSYGGMSLSAICPESSINNTNTSMIGQRRLVVRRTYLWTGGGSCRGCNPDNTDMSKINLTESNWKRHLSDQLIPLIELQLNSIVSLEVVPYHQRCLGVNPLINVTASRIGVTGVPSKCNVNALPTLSVSNLEKNKYFAFQGSVCQACISLDFSSIGANMQINPGTYVSTQWKNTYGVTINASSSVGGFTPYSQARIYDTRQIVLNGEGDIDLGSPNTNCGGLGVGLGGQIGQTGENCFPINSKLSIL